MEFMHQHLFCVIFTEQVPKEKCMKMKQSMHTSTAGYDKFDSKRKRMTANSFFLSSLLEVSQEHFLSRGSNQNKPKGNTTACSYTVIQCWKKNTKTS